MSTDHLHSALRELVADADADVALPDADLLWTRGRRRRLASGIVPVVIVACVAMLAAGLAWPLTTAREALPSVRFDDGTLRLTAYPAVISKPPFMRETTTPGITAAVVPGSDHLSPVYAVSPAGTVTRVALPRDESKLASAPSLSPDGRWLARGPVLVDLVTGASVPSTPEQVRLGRELAPPDQPSWWSPDSRRAFVGTFNQGVPTSAGLVVGIDGSTDPVPLVESGLVPIFAGWLDSNTLLALVGTGAGSSRLEVRTWVFGDPVWQANGAVVSWSRDSSDSSDSEGGRLRAHLSPDGSRMQVTAVGDEIDPGAGSQQETVAMMFDPRTGAQLGMPTAGGELDPSSWAPGTLAGWPGWGCRTAWHDGLPVITDGVVRVAFAAAGDDLVSVSSDFGERCVAFAGDELRGMPVTDQSALWQERLWRWGVPLLGLAFLALAIWWWGRRHRGSWRERPRWLPSILPQSF